MKSPRSFLVVILAALSVCGFGQASNGAAWIEERLNSELDHRGKPSASIGEFGFNFVFLFDASQAGWKSPYRAFVQATIESFLNKQLGAAGGSSTSFALYSYQTSLYDQPGQYLPLTPLTKAEVSRVGDVLPKDRFSVGPRGEDLSSKGGHDHSRARRQLLDLLKSQFPSPAPDLEKPIIVIQFTTVPFNELPGDLRKDRQVRRLDARSALLDDTGFAGYDVPGLPLKTEVPSVGLEPFPVYVWLYGPERFNQIKLAKSHTDIVNDDKKASVEPPVDRNGSSTLPLLILLAVTLVTAAWFFLRPLRVTVLRSGKEIHGVTVRRNSIMPICGPGTQNPGPNALVLSETDAPGSPKGRLGVVRIPLMGTPYVEGSLYALDAPGAKGGRLALDRPRPFRFRSKTDGLTTSSLSVKIG